MKNYCKILKIAPVFFLAGTVMFEAQQKDSIRQKDIDQVVIVGYGTQKKSDITGAVSSVKTKDIEKFPVTRADQALQGRVPGLAIQNTSASPNANVVIRIRGANSINGGNDPLVVIDGIQGGNLNTLNPADVLSYEVLKDASATAIYGSRGANGVILITTKKGKGKLSLSYNGFYSSNFIAKRIDMMNAEQYALTVNANRLERGIAQPFSASDIAGFRANGGTDWFNLITRGGFNTNHTLSIGGADEKTSYYISGNYTGQDGIILNTSYQRFSLRSNISTQVTKKFNVSLNLFASREIDHPTALNTFAGENGGSPINAALQFAPVKPVYGANGNYTLPGGGYGPPTVYNPLALAKEPIRDFYTNSLSSVLNLSYEFTKGLKLTVIGSYNNINRSLNSYINSKPANNPGAEEASIDNQRAYTLQNTNMLTYEKDFNKHNLKITAVAEQQYEEAIGLLSRAKGFANDAFTYNNLALGKTQLTPIATRTERSLLSYMGRVNYGYDSRYLITITARADGSSVFGKNNKWGYFPAIGLSWNIMNEKFVGDFFNVLKLRGSYGIIGNQAINPYQSLSTLTSNFLYAQNGSALSQAIELWGLANPDLKWEKTAQYNVGLDGGFLKNRIDFSIDYYNKKTTDLLLKVPLPAAAGGQGTILRNVGSVENKGFEFLVSGKPVIGTFNWETTLTMGINKNKVLSLYDDKTEINLEDIGLPGINKSLWLQVGEPIGLFRGYNFLGTWKTAEAAEAAKYGALPGDSKYEDVDHNGKIDGKDFVNIGNAQPKFTYGWNNNITYKNFDLNIFIQGAVGNKVYNISRVRFETSTADADAVSPKILDRWTAQNETEIPTFRGSNDGKLNSSRWLEDGSYLRFKNISLGYKLPESLVSRLEISSARLYLSGNNLITLTKYSGFDPEASSGVDTRLGVDLASYPSQKSIIIGLDIKF